MRDQPLTALQQALIARVRARAAYALQRDRDAIRLLLAAAQGLDGLAPELARDTYIEALAASLHGGRLGDPELVAAVARAILESPIGQASEHPLDLLLRGQALLAADGHEAAFPTLSRALGAFVATPPDAPAMLWLWFASRTAIDLWDSEALRALADRQVDLARAAGALTVLPIALSMAMIKRTFDGRLDLAEAACDEIDVVQAVTGSPLPQYGRLFLAAYRGRLEEVEQRTRQIRADALQRGEGYGLSIANFAEAIAYNGAGRYAEAVAAAREELPYTHELAYAARCLLELVEAASRSGERALAEEAVEHLAGVTRPAGTNWARAILALAEALIGDGDEATRRYEEAIERFEREQVPIFAARGRLLLGETLRRRHRRIEAREQLRAAHAVLSACGMNAFADRAARELSATGETMRVRSPDTLDDLTPQELNIARLAREGLTNREIGARLFISARTAEYHLRKVFIKLGITSRGELRTAALD